MINPIFIPCVFYYFRKDFQPHYNIQITPTKTHPQDGGDTTTSDLLLAQMLQLEYDREHDRQLNIEEKHFNQHNKGTVHVVTYIYTCIYIV